MLRKYVEIFWYNWTQQCVLLQEGELYKFIIESDDNNDGVLDFQEFKAAIKLAQKKLKESEGEQWTSLLQLCGYLHDYFKIY